jgi:hypothetical protein
MAAAKRYGGTISVTDQPVAPVSWEVAMRRIPYDQYVAKKGRTPVIIHFQPDYFVEFESDKERQEWAKQLSVKLGVDVAGKGFTWGTPTFSGDVDRNPRVGDDCEVDDE